MATTISRIIKYGIQSFLRNGLLSVATVVVMILALMVFEGLIIFRVLTDTAVTSLQDKIDISVYFKTNAPESDILKIKNSLETAKEVKNVEYISREKALEIFQNKYKNDPTISQALTELDTNPLLASLNIKAYDPNDYKIIASYLEADNFKDFIDKVTFTQSRLAIERLSKFIDTAEKIGLILTFFLAITAILVTFNTIRLAIYSNREEIGIMRLVGASNIFINGPYIVEAIIFGVLAAVFSLIILGPFINIGSTYVKSFIPEMDLSVYFYGNLFKLFGYQLLFGIVLGVISGSIAIKKYLKI